MTQAAIEVLSPLRDQVGESPVWCERAQALYWVDIEGRAIRRHHLASGVTRSWRTAERVACIATRASGGLVAGMETGLFAVDLPEQGEDAQVSLLQSITHPREGMRFNDGRCDRAGRFWASTMVRDMSLAAADGALFRFDAQGLSQPQVGGLLTGNGLAFSPDNKLMYLSDSHPQARRVWRLDLHEDGTLSNRREFVDMNQHPGRPDGAAMDAEGCYWVCGNDAGQVHRFTPEGRLDRSIQLPVSKPAMCSFGGPNFEWMFITSIPPAKPAQGFDASLDGAVLALRPGVRGLPETPFAH